MRFANLDGRLVLSTSGGYADVAGASQGRFGPGPGDALDGSGRRSAHGLPSKTAGPAGVPGRVRRSRAPERRRRASPLSGAVSEAGVRHRPQLPRARRRVRSGRARLSCRVHQVPELHHRPDQRQSSCPAGTVDWEVELVVVIGRRAHRVGEDEASDYVAGVHGGPGRLRARAAAGRPAAAVQPGQVAARLRPLGPWLVTLDEIADPDDLELGCEVNGEVVQLRPDQRADLLGARADREPVGRLPLLPGDVIFTGTPSGVGSAAPRSASSPPGDVLTSHIEGIGRLRNRAARWTAPRPHRATRRVGDRRGPAPADPHRDGRAERRGDGRATTRSSGSPRPAASVADAGGRTAGERTFATVDGGEQLRIVHSPPAAAGPARHRRRRPGRPRPGRRLAGRARRRRRAHRDQRPRGRSGHRGDRPGRDRRPRRPGADPGAGRTTPRA